ncbi:hypothetical protein V1264_023624 [Littorina saxatilis]|uniref:Uncharacterized protein n=1 Tax=Littorina saxatilis TaxID=31220 RepID=A0AAN9G9L4_9CAEN
MSFLGCIGHLMGGSGLQKLLEFVFAPNAVSHMLSGKAIARAVRGHLLVESVLNALITSATFNSPLPSSIDSEARAMGPVAEENDVKVPPARTETAMEEDGISAPCEPNRNTEMNSTVTSANPILQSALSLYDQITRQDLSTQTNNVLQNPDLDKIQEMLDNTKQKFHDQSRTARLWLQYLELIRILRRFLKAERTGNWQLHLDSLQQMLPYLAAAGHCSYRLN